MEEKAKPRHIRRRRILRCAILALGLASIGAITAISGVIGAYYYVQPSLASAETIRDIRLEVPLRIFSRDGYLISEIGERKRIPVTYEEIPEHVVQAFIAAEDRRFFEHPGIDYRGFLRAATRLITTGNASGGGGSTLTQQLARDYFLTREQTLERKLTEAFLAWKIEQEFTKEQIMALFLNKMFFGQRAYGIAASAQVFFNKDLGDVNIAEAATLAGVNAPYVAEMVRSQMLTRYGEKTYTAGFQVVTSLDSRLQQAANYSLRNGLLEFTRRRGYRGPIEQVELTEDMLLLPTDQWPPDILAPLNRYATGGLSLALVMNVSENNEATILFRDGQKTVLPWTGIRWANPFIDRETSGPPPASAAEVLSRGDIIYVMPTADERWALAQVPEAQSAVVSIDPYDGAVTALTGGFDYTTSKFNRARQAYRQPGSAFKPFIYSAALEHGNTPATVVLDAPVVISSSELEAIWRPINYSGRFYGPTRMREALVRSMNLVSVRLLLFETGIGNAVRHLRKFGFSEATLIRNGSLALGGGQASPLDMAQGYAMLANGGHAVKPYIIDSIFGPTGEALFHAEPAIVCDRCVPDEPDLISEIEILTDEDLIDPELFLEQMADVVLSYRPDATDAPELFEGMNLAPQAITPQNAFLIQDMMRDVVRRGTGVRARRELGRSDLSGKTGTSNDRRDAWFGGFNADFAAVVWVGYDDDLPLGPREEGSRTALPIWIEFVRGALINTPEHQMPMPEGIVSVKIDRATGCPARSGQADVTFEVFRVGNIPDCEQLEEITDPFNNAAGIDPDPEDEENQDDEVDLIF